MQEKMLRSVGFDFAYLARLTHAGLKPLSRWEKPLRGPEVSYLEGLGLQTAFVGRRLRNGSQTTELIFARVEPLLDIYLAKFEGSLIDKSIETQRLEGYLFGYPPCCVEAFAQNGYQQNDLDEKDQQLLFHWACPGCSVTPILLLDYRQIHDDCERRLRGEHQSSQASPSNAKWMARTKAGIAVAASVALVVTGAATHLLAAQHGVQTFDDPHLLPLSPDIDGDQDFLLDDEESYLGTDPGVADENLNGVLDGVELAQSYAATVNALPRDTSDAEPYAVDVEMYGSETCAICGELVNMGYIRVTNPLENLSVDVNYIALHYMEHGSFQFDGSVNAGRVEVSVLRTVLESPGGQHLLAATADSDNDGLRDAQEPFFGLDSTKADSDKDGLLDGVELARDLARIVDQLDSAVQEEHPYVEEFLFRGVETCDVCGKVLNMGFLRITNPVEDLSIDVPFMALHFMRCGSFVYSGSTNRGTVDARVLNMITDRDTGKHWLQVQDDDDSDGLVDPDEKFFGTDVSSRDSDCDGIPDGPQVAQDMWVAIESLPRDTSDVQPYRLDFEMDGLEICHACGEAVNMGFLQVINPLESIVVEIPYIALHYLQHGSLLYDGDYHGAGAIHTRGLYCSLNSDGSMHLLPMQDDSDNDGLSTSEEDSLGMNPNNPDEDADGVLDGVWLAKHFRAAIKSLPTEPDGQNVYAESHLMWGLEACEICGEMVNMGFWNIVNPVAQESLAVYEIGLHYMEHGSFSYNGDLHDGRVDPVALARILGSTPTAVSPSEGGFPKGYRLHQNYPNPFNSSAVIRFDLPRQTVATLKIYDLLGKCVRTLVDDEQSMGRHVVAWDGNDAHGQPAASGIYFCRLSVAEQHVGLRRLLLLR